MNRPQKAVFTKELQKASAALSNAFKLVARDDDANLTLMKMLKDQQRAIGELIVSINGGPVLSITELMS